MGEKNFCIHLSHQLFLIGHFTQGCQHLKLKFKSQLVMFMKGFHVGNINNYVLCTNVHVLGLKILERPSSFDF